MTSKQRILERKVNLKELVDKLSIDSDGLEDAVREQPRLFLETGRYRAMKSRRRAKAAFAFERAMAEERLQHRKKKDDKGRKVMTEGAVADTAMLSPEALLTRQKMDEAYVDEDFAKVLTECYRQRGNMLGIIAQIRLSERNAEIASVRENLARDEMNQHSQKVRERLKHRGEDNT